MPANSRWDLIRRLRVNHISVPKTATSINTHVLFTLSQIMMSSLLSGTILSICTCWLLHMVTLPSQLVSTNFGIWSYQCSFSNFTPLSLHMLKCSWAHTLSCLFVYCSFTNIGDADKRCSTVSSNWWQCQHLQFIIYYHCCYYWLNHTSQHLPTGKPSPIPDSQWY